MRPGLLWIAVATTVAGTAAAADEPPRLEASEPRAFGYQIGDLVPRRVAVFVPAGWQLDEASLPRAGGRGRAIELRRVVRRDSAVDGGRRIELDLEYQVLTSPAAVRTFEIAPWRLRLESAGRAEELRVEAAPVTVAPLVPVEVSPRHGLGELQPDRAAPAIDTTRWRWRLAVWSVLAAACVVWLGWIHLGPPWQAARARPFGRAWKQLRRLPPQAAGAEWRAACRRLHEALDRSAGETLFEAGLDRFVATAPRFAALRGELARFLAVSRREFFGDGAHEAGDPAWLVGLARRLRDAERGGA